MPIYKDVKTLFDGHNNNDSDGFVASDIPATRVEVDTKKTKLRENLRPIIHDFKFTDDFVHDKQILALLLRIRQSLNEPVENTQYIGSQTLGKYFDTEKTTFMNSPFPLGAWVQEAILCNIIQDHLDLKPISPGIGGEEVLGQAQADERHNRIVNARKDYQPAESIDIEVENKFREYLKTEAAQVKLNIENLILSKNSDKEKFYKKDPSVLKMSVLKAAKEALNAFPGESFLINLAKYEYFLDVYDPGLRAKRGKPKEKSNYSYFTDPFQDRTDITLENIENLANKFDEYMKMQKESPQTQAYTCYALRVFLLQQIEITQTEILNDTSKTKELAFLTTAKLLLTDAYLDKNRSSYKDLDRNHTDPKMIALSSKMDNFITTMEGFNTQINLLQPYYNNNRSALPRENPALTEYKKLCADDPLQGLKKNTAASSSSKT